MVEKVLGRIHSSKVSAKTSKLLLLFLVFFIFIVASFPKIPMVNAAPAWYDSNWKYRKSHAMSALSGGGINWVIYINVYNGSGTDSGFNVYLNNKFKTNFADLRFTDDDGVTLLDHWVDTIGSTFTIVWIEIKDDVSSAFSFYIYYGNSAASDASSGANTFLFFENFDAQWLAAGKWTQIKVSDNDWLAAINDTAIYRTAPNAAEVYDDGSVTLTANSYTVLRSKTISWTQGKKVTLDFKEYHTSTQTVGSKQYAMYGIYYGTGIGYSYTDVSNGKSAWNVVMNGYPTTTATTGYIEIGSYTSVLVNAADGINWYCRFDNVRVRYGTGTNPTNGAWGLEEYFPPITIYYLSAKGTVYYNSSQGVAWTAIPNATTIYRGLYNLGFMALPASNKTYVNILVNSTTYYTGNPQVIFIDGTTSIWINFIDRVTLSGNATSNQVLSGNTFSNSTGAFTGDYIPPESGIGRPEIFAGFIVMCLILVPTVIYFVLRRRR